MLNYRERRLLARDQVEALLQLPPEGVQRLIDTRQLLAIRIAGQERFDSKDLYQLVEAYKITSARRAH